MNYQTFSMSQALTSLLQEPATAAVLADMERHEVVGGEVVQKASPTARHSYVQARLAAALDPFQPDGDGPGGWLILSECTVELETHEVYQPDLAGWRAARLSVLPDTFPIQIAPDWVCEVLSPSTAARDLNVKRRGYHRAKVPHYWIVDPFNRTLSVLQWMDDAYALILAAGPNDVVHAVPFAEIALHVSKLLGCGIASAPVT